MKLLKIVDRKFNSQVKQLSPSLDFKIERDTHILSSNGRLSQTM